jgi:pyridoxamine 5'-phosphate oxidase
MINLEKLNNSEPYRIFNKFYENALENNQDIIQAILIASMDKKNDEVEARFVNLKYIIDNEWIFFSNYNSPKAKQFSSHNQVSAVIFWSSINVQIRMKAKIFKTDKFFSNNYFTNRSGSKNALAISSAQSDTIHSYEDVVQNYNDALESSAIDTRPSYWGGYSFIPYYFEFWQGHESRLNKRDVYEKDGDNWHHSLLQP